MRPRQTVRTQIAALLLAALVCACHGAPTSHNGARVRDGNTANTGCDDSGNCEAGDSYGGEAGEVDGTDAGTAMPAPAVPGSEDWGSDVHSEWFDFRDDGSEGADDAEGPTDAAFTDEDFEEMDETDAGDGANAADGGDGAGAISADDAVADDGAPADTAAGEGAAEGDDYYNGEGDVQDNYYDETETGTATDGGV